MSCHVPGYLVLICFDKANLCDIVIFKDSVGITKLAFSRGSNRYRLGINNDISRLAGNCRAIGNSSHNQFVFANVYRGSLIIINHVLAIHEVCSSSRKSHILIFSCASIF